MSQVFAMVASMEAFVPILSSMIYSNLYNATIELAYPWQGSFYFLSIGLTIIGNISAWMNPVKHRSHVCARRRGDRLRVRVPGLQADPVRGGGGEGEKLPQAELQPPPGRGQQLQQAGRAALSFYEKGQEV